MDERMRSTAAAARVLTYIYPSCARRFASLLATEKPPPPSSSKTQKSISVVCVLSLAHTYFSSKRLSRP